MHEGNGLSCKEQVRQRKEKEKKKKMQGWGMKRYVQKREIRAERTLGKKKIKEDAEAEVIWYNAIRDHDCARGNNKSSAQKTNLGSRETETEKREREKKTKQSDKKNDTSVGISFMQS